MNIFCRLFGCKQRDCTEEVAREVKKSQENCNQIIRTREGTLKIKHAVEMAELTGVYRKCCIDRTYWQQRHYDCMKNKPTESKAIKSLEVKDGKFWVNGKVTKLYGVSKREAIAVGSGDKPQVEINYKYTDIKKALLNSNINYIRVLAGKYLGFFRNEVMDYLAHGIVVEVELWDAGNPYKEYQADWMDTFDAVKDLPVFFDAHNEFTERGGVETVQMIVDYVTSRGGIISAGAWWSVAGKQLSQEFKGICSSYQISSHHRSWTKKSLQESMEVGKPIVMSELHSKSISFQGMKDLFKKFFNWDCQGVNIYPLMNWGSGTGSNFQKILDWVSEFRMENER